MDDFPFLKIKSNLSGLAARAIYHRKNCECCAVSLFIVRSLRLSWLRYSTFRNVFSFTRLHKSVQECFPSVLEIGHGHGHGLNCQNLSKNSKIVKIQNICPKLSKIVKIVKKLVKIGKNCQKLSKLSKKIVKKLSTLLKIVKIVKNGGQVMFPHQSGQMSQRSQVSRVAL